MNPTFILASCPRISEFDVSLSNDDVFQMTFVHFLVATEMSDFIFFSGLAHHNFTDFPSVCEVICPVQYSISCRLEKSRLA